MKNEILLGDARELIKKIPDNSVDLILTDPPYSLGFGKYDDSEVFFELEEELFRVLKPNSFMVVYWSIKRLADIFKKIKRFEYVWQMICYFSSTYSKSILGDRKYAPIIVFVKGKPKVKYKNTDFVYAMELPFINTKIGNPLFKPTVATSQLLQMFSNEGDLVLDPFMGFGSIILCCKFWKRNYIGFEIDKEIFKVAEKIINTGRVEYIGKLPAKDERQGNLL